MHGCNIEEDNEKRLLEMDYIPQQGPSSKLNSAHLTERRQKEINRRGGEKERIQL